MMDQTHKDDAERRLGPALVLLCEWGLRVQSPLGNVLLPILYERGEQYSLPH